MDALPSLGLVDVVALAAIAFAALRGYFRGLSGELAGLIGNAGSLLVGVGCYRAIGDWLQHNSKVTGASALALAFGGIVVGGILFTMVLRWTVGRIFRVVVEDGINRTGGVVAGILRGLVVVTIVFALLNMLPNERVHRKFVNESVIGTLVQRVIPQLSGASDKNEEVEIPAR